MDKVKNNILVVVRSDAEKKNGGDYQMMLAFLKELGREHNASIFHGVPSRDQLEGIDVVLCTNLDRPVEALVTMRLCKKKSIIFLLYSLHHPYAGISAYLRHGVRGFKRLIATISFYRPQRYEEILWRLRTAITLIREMRCLPQYSVSKAQRELLCQADAVICCASKEIDTISRDIMQPHRSYVVPHPADAPLAVNADAVKSRIVVAGRIEARKNQIGALEMAKSLPDHDFVFVGARVSSEILYFKKFMSLLNETPNASYRSELPKDDFYPFIASAELVLNPSFFEVTSLVDVYCLSNGIPLVTTKYTYLEGSGCFYTFLPEDTESGVIAIKSCVSHIRVFGRNSNMIGDDSAVTISEVIRNFL
jgi:glycosyltransferase involved in cell wall biosynthesis